jgi:hypothetical protein
MCNTLIHLIYADSLSERRAADRRRWVRPTPKPASVRRPTR